MIVHLWNSGISTCVECVEIPAHDNLPACHAAAKCSVQQRSHGLCYAHHESLVVSSCALFWAIKNQIKGDFLHKNILVLIIMSNLYIYMSKDPLQLFDQLMKGDHLYDLFAKLPIFYQFRHDEAKI